MLKTIATYQHVVPAIFVLSAMEIKKAVIMPDNNLKFFSGLTDLILLVQK
ncbi:hypothetical protein LJ707_16475 [Mucilaginibacter sp. UR6-1]|nr:hypothetical protein [Mucilaginibacter sp. UR6-1]MCC8410540.1 hypothetical protein [Mucilaginibacter sp. UR6-1]